MPDRLVRVFRVYTKVQESEGSVWETRSDGFNSNVQLCGAECVKRYTFLEEDGFQEQTIPAHQPRTGIRLAKTGEVLMQDCLREREGEQVFLPSWETLLSDQWLNTSSFCKPTSLVLLMDTMKSKNGSSPARCPGEFSCTWERKKTEVMDVCAGKGWDVTHGCEKNKTRQVKSFQSLHSVLVWNEC